MRGSERTRGGTILGALCLGHIAAALSFSSTDLVAVMIFDPSVPVTEPCRFATELLTAALGLPLLMLFIMLPFSLLTSPFVLMAASSFRAGAGTALTVGAIVGAAWVAGFVYMSGDLPGTWSRAGDPGDPRTLALIVADGAAAGMAYAWVVWSRCIRPFRGRGAPMAPATRVEVGR